jgi:transposase
MGENLSVKEDRSMDTAVLEAISGLLDLEGFEIVETTSDRTKKARVMTMVATMIAAPCPHCGTATADRHACHDRRVVDLPWCGWQTELIIKLFQFKCDRCRKYFTPQYPGLSTNGAHATERFLEQLADLATHGDVSGAARFLGIAEKTAEDWYYDYLKRKQKEPAKDLQPIRSLGVDELSLKKDTVNSAVC